ncbi:MAG: transketolase family protein [Sphaerochaetaceae bacterium]|jgi:transketolase|nr:transketolase family protein [Sphaerochaetaceae bacterium]MDD3162894.1 transketolase family protein [Sphaerochaetaceae bacterium]MDD4007119.1 transketolase family protein [Sphaerochaetaceae bacterium]MDD4396774.1 transketolase family protein [Sphaerochaetaceae bacterium]
MSTVTGTTWNCYDSATMTPREIYGRTLAEMAKTNDKIVGLTADLEKTTAMIYFAQAFPERFFNVGIAEQDMMGAAAGLAKCGLIPFASTMAAFASMRAAEQVRTDICYQNLPVKIIATHSGISFGHAGTTHHCTEDLAIMRSFANMTVIAPADGIETSLAVRACMDIPGPVYIRIGRGFEPPVFQDENHEFKIGKAIEMNPGKDLTIICCGIAVLQSVLAAKQLAEQDGLSVRVINMHTIKPIDREAIMKAVTETRRILTIEEHNTIGGLGDAVGSVIAESGKGCVFRKHGMQDCFSEIGYAEDLYSYYGFDADGIVAKVREMMGLEFEADENWEDE